MYSITPLTNTDIQWHRRNLCKLVLENVHLMFGPWDYSGRGITIFETILQHQIVML